MNLIDRKHEERDLEEQCSELLALDGWRSLKTDPKHLRGLGVLEKGIPDRLYVRYRHECDGRECACDENGATGRANVLWIEWKAKKGKHRQSQIDWQALEIKRGALLWVAKKDFEPTVEAFWKHYRESGLMRNKTITIGATRR